MEARVRINVARLIFAEGRATVRPFTEIKGETHMATLVKMKTADGKTADVHPDMVEEYKSGGYVEEKPKAKSSKKKAD